MRDACNAKAMAKTLRQELKSKSIELGHVECLDITAKMFGFRNWNTMEATNKLPDESGIMLSVMPKGWEISGSKKSAFNIGVEEKGGPQRQNAILMHSKPNQVVNGSEWCCCYPQYFSAEKFIGKTVEFSAMLKCENLDAEAYLWFRIDNEFQDRIAYIGRWEIPEENVLTSTRTWHKQSISILVPKEAATMYFGATLYGQGKLWLADIAFGETSAKDTRVRLNVATEPQNLDLRVA